MPEREPYKDVADFLKRGSQEEDQDTEIELEVLEDNWNAVLVFRHCAQHWIAGMGGAAALGITATEARAAMSGLGIRHEDDPFVFAYVIEMGHEAARALNQKSK